MHSAYLLAAGLFLSSIFALWAGIPVLCMETCKVCEWCPFFLRGFICFWQTEHFNLICDWAYPEHGSASEAGSFLTRPYCWGSTASQGFFKDPPPGGDAESTVLSSQYYQPAEISVKLLSLRAATSCLSSQLFAANKLAKSSRERQQSTQARLPAVLRVWEPPGHFLCPRMPPRM